MLCPARGGRDHVPGRQRRHRRVQPAGPGRGELNGRARALGLLLGTAADALFGDPSRWHPVAGFGRCATWWERRCYADTRAAGLVHLVVAAGAATMIGAALGRVGAAGSRDGAPPERAGEPARTAVVAVATWAVLGGSSLAGQAAALADSLDPLDLPAAQAHIPHLCGRDPSALDAAGMARAGCESIAENTSDAVVGPLLWGALAGVPGLLGYRAVNTLDAMVGYRSPRYRNFGWAAARCDDLLNLAPARLTAGLIVALAPPLGGSASGALRVWRRDAGLHPSPNAGPVEAAAAGALGIRLGGRTVYPYAVEQRPVLGDGRPPRPADLRRIARLSRAVSWAAVLVAAALALVVGKVSSARSAPGALRAGSTVACRHRVRLGRRR